MANQTKILNKRTAVLTYDGRDWSAFCFHRNAVSRLNEAGGSNSIPVGILNFLHEQKTRVVRILLDGEVSRLETSLPAKLAFGEASQMLAHEIAEQSGGDGMELVCAGGSGSLVGVLEPCLITGAFERQRVDGLHQQLNQSGFQFDGVGSLELACASHWNAHRNRDKETLILFGRDHGFVLPARNLPDQPGPLSLSGGLRQLERDPETWKTRFARGNRYLMNGESLSVFVLGAETFHMAPVLGAIENFPKPDYPELDALLEGAARQAALGQANQFNTPVPIRNPHVLRKRFNHAFIVIPSLLILILSVAGPWGLSELLLHSVKSEYQDVVAELGPLEKRIEEAEKRKSQVKGNYDSAVNLQQKLADRRKPLFAFIHLTYFFSKYAGDTVRLESISDRGGMIEVRGVYTDPEEGLTLGTELNKFSADKNLRIVRNRVAERRDAEGKVVLELELDVDYRKLR